MGPEEHIRKAEEYLESADNRTNSTEWALVEAELAKSHLLAAAVKKGLSLTDHSKPFGILRHLVS